MPGGGTGGDAAAESLERAQHLLAVGRMADAERHARAALALGALDAAAWCVLTRAIWGQGKRFEALDCARAGCEAAPEDEWPHRLTALLLDSLGRREEALRAAGQAVRLAPDCPEALACLATMRLRTGDLRGARLTACRALELGPNLALSHLTLGDVHLGAADLAAAESSYREALRRDPESATCWNNLGVALDRQGRRLEAIAAFREAARYGTEAAVAPENLRAALDRWLRPSFRGVGRIAVLALVVAMGMACLGPLAAIGSAMALVLGILGVAGVATFRIARSGVRLARTERALRSDWLEREMRTAGETLFRVSLAVGITALLMATLIVLADATVLREPALWTFAAGGTLATVVPLAWRRRARRRGRWRAGTVSR